MLPQLCPSSRFQSPKHPPGPFAAPSLTRETGLGFSGPRDVSSSAGWLRRGEALQKNGEGLEAAMEGPWQAHPEEGQGLLGSLIWGLPSGQRSKARLRIAKPVSSPHPYSEPGLWEPHIVSPILELAESRPLAGKNVGEIEYWIFPLAWRKNLTVLKWLEQLA